MNCIIFIVLLAMFNQTSIAFTSIESIAFLNVNQIQTEPISSASSEKNYKKNYFFDKQGRIIREELICSPGCVESKITTYSYDIPRFGFSCYDYNCSSLIQQKTLTTHDNLFLHAKNNKKQENKTCKLMPFMYKCLILEDFYYSHFESNLSFESNNILIKNNILNIGKPIPMDTFIISLSLEESGRRKRNV